VLVSGKLYYELAEEREKRGYSDTALVRVEEFAPFPIDQISVELGKYKNAKQFIWAQEEPQNGGFWYYVQPRLDQLQKVRKK
jgi:probable 2-oxoglutarate dehydrogenase E1 component DHKTD1